MDFEIREAGSDPPIVNVDSTGFGLSSRSGSGYFRGYQGNGFSFWNNSYYFSSDTTLQARADIPVLELHITRTGIWKGNWDGVPELDLHAGQFNLSYTPHVLTSVHFRKQMAYRSCDIHFSFDYLQSLSHECPELNEFLLSAIKHAPATIAARNHYCTREMTEAAEAIINNPYDEKTQTTFLAIKVKDILMAALEKISYDARRPLLTLRNYEKEALIHVKKLIERKAINPATHEELSRLSGLNEFTLKRGFRLLFGVSPYQYHIQQKMARAKILLLETKDDIWSIAYDLGYSQPSSFGHEFRKLTGLTPLEYRNKKGPSMNEEPPKQ